jgi:Ribonuclease G/E
MPQMLLFHCVAEINQPKNAVLRKIARIGQEAQFACRKASRSQTTNEYKAKYTYCRRMGAKMTTQGREDNILGGVPPEVGQSAMQIE